MSKDPRTSADYLTALLDATVDGIVAIRADGVMVDVNAATLRIFGYDRTELIGQNVSMLMPDPDRGRHDGYIGAYLESGEAKIIGIGRDVRGMRSDGSTFPMNLAVGEFTLDGAPMFTGIIRDISHTQALREELAHAQRLEAVGQLTGGIAHDFNNLLAVVQGNLELLETGVPEGGEDLELIEDALEAVGMGSELTGRLLAFARRQPLEPKIIELSELVINMTDLLQRALGGAVDIDVRIGTDPGSVKIDPAQMQNALLNLAINSRDAMPRGGLLDIHLEQRAISGSDRSGAPVGDYVALAVRDTGAGMTDVVRACAFEPFFTTKDTGAGTGLGLSQVYGFVKQSGGYITVTSEPSVGTEVVILLPKVVAHSSSVRATEERPRQSLSGKRVLLVEDDDKVRKSTARRLLGLGCEVVEVSNGQGALDQLINGNRFDLMLTDVVMPGMTGTKLAAAVHELKPDLPILFTSGYAEDVLAESTHFQSAPTLRKPYSGSELAQAIGSILIP